MIPLAALAISAITACSTDLTGSNTRPVKLSVTTHAGAAAAANRVVADLIAGPNNELVLEKVQLVFTRIELDRVGTTDCVGGLEDEDEADNRRGGDDNSGPGSGENNRGRHHGECEEVSHNPLLVDVPVDDALHPVIEVPLPEGTFRELEAKLRPARADRAQFNTANPNLAGKSVRVEGTFNGTPFVFTSAVRAKLEMEFAPPLVIDEATKNATVSIDVRNWFLNADGTVIDPTTATPGSTAMLRIENSIRRSFHAFEDDEERGEDRHGDNHGNDDGENH